MPNDILACTIDLGMGRESTGHNHVYGCGPRYLSRKFVVARVMTQLAEHVEFSTLASEISGRHHSADERNKWPLPFTEA